MSPGNRGSTVVDFPLKSQETSQNFLSIYFGLHSHGTILDILILFLCKSNRIHRLSSKQCSFLCGFLQIYQVKGQKIRTCINYFFYRVGFLQLV